MDVMLQKILWPQIGVCMQNELYFQLENAYRSERKLVFRKGGCADFASYFNSFSIDKWRRYTVVKNVDLSLSLRGRFVVALWASNYVNGKLSQTILAEQEVSSTAEIPVRLSFPAGTGVLSFTLTALDEDCEFYGGGYHATVEAEQFQNVKLGLDICTFRRETFVLGNLERFRTEITENKKSLLHGHVEIFVSDNGQTLDAVRLNNETVHVVPNPNVGGSGGFTRGMIEIMKANERGAGITHVLIMDDDIVFSMDVLYRTYLLLCLRNEKYQDAFIGGAMLRLDRPWHQVECGASWNAGQLISHKANFNLRKYKYCVLNELPEHHEYNAWWYCCVPIAVIRPDNLPLPLFIRGDDVEYGLRNCKKLMTMNGICVWHEPFESKYSSSTYYYILRNQCIDNALHCPEYGKEALKANLKAQVLGEINRYRYKNADLLVRGVRDFLKGIDWLKQADAEALHKEIMAAGYKPVPVEQADIPFDYSRYNYTLNEEKETPKKKILMRLTKNGHMLPATREDTIVSAMYMTAYNAYRVKRVLNYNPNNQTAFVTEQSISEYRRCIREMKACMREIDAKYDAACNSYLKRHKELESLDFWKKYLGLGNEN